MREGEVERVNPDNWFPRAISFSIVFHLLLLSVLVWRIKEEVTNQSTTAIAIDLQEIEVVQPAVNVRSEKHTKPRELKLADLAPSRIKTNIDSSYERTTDLLSFGAADELKNHDKIGLFHYLYTRIDRVLTYPDDYKTAGIQGEVHGDISFLEDGTYLGERTKLEGTSGYVKVLAARALKKGLADPLLPSLIKPPRRFSIHCTFRFEFSEGDGPELQAQNRLISSTRFIFYRNHHHSRLQWEVGPFSGMFPIPFLGISLGWFFEKGKNLIERKPKIDPLQKYRDDPEY